MYHGLKFCVFCVLLPMDQRIQTGRRNGASELPLSTPAILTSARLFFGSQICVQTTQNDLYGTAVGKKKSSEKCQIFVHCSAYDRSDVAIAESSFVMPVLSAARFRPGVVWNGRLSLLFDHRSLQSHARLSTQLAKYTTLTTILQFSLYS